MLQSIYTTIEMKWCLFVCLSFNQAKPTTPNSISIWTKTFYLPGSDISLFAFRYLPPFQVCSNSLYISRIVLPLTYHDFSVTTERISMKIGT